ncbi:hypothetical protein J437_LFUL006006 [Ladona fulva]|uniref:Phosphatidylinositol-glycan biosynthesis class F protein n=1 Tax=Ladona fulva TaxID=123851 RepID=A0A8K0JYG1_LADFU|nr:hypothetical protein J437_LFUL006006 [Ladona fulva]
MLSVLLCVLTVVHACVNLGSQSAMNVILGMEPQSSIGKMVQRNVYGTLLGTWFGAFFIPLDWDKPWQEWPITCALGGLFGFTFSNIMSMCVVLHQQSKREKHGRKML